MNRTWKNRSSVLVSVFGVVTGAADAQTVSGIVFEDVDRDGVRDWGEPALGGIPVVLYGNQSADDFSATTASDGSYVFTAAVGARYVLDVAPGGGLRMSFQDLGADPDPIPDWPQGRRRPGVLDHLVAHLRASTGPAPLHHVALGDSIAFGFNLCDSIGGGNDYVTPFTGRLDDAGFARLSKLAVSGYETNDLLDPSQGGTVFDAVSNAAALVTISIGGNDFLKDDGDTAATAANLVAARQNLQEILSSLLSELPDVDVVINTVYDNEGGNDAFHDTWAPIWNQVVRDVAWGQRRRVGIAEIWPDYEHRDPATGTILGEDNLICQAFGFDGIHPKKRGYDLHEEKLWQGVGGLDVASGANERHFGFLRPIGTRLPASFQDVGGSASQEQDALVQDDVGAIVPGGPASGQELRVFGFDATPRGLLSQVVVNVRYRVNAPPGDDWHRFEAAVDGTFSAPGSTATTWNTLVPIVGGAGNGVPVHAFPDQAGWRDVSALVTKGSAIDGSPSLAWQDLATLAVRVRCGKIGSADTYDVEWDVASLDLYGIPPYRLLVRGDPVLGGTLQIEATGREGDSDYLFASTGTGSTPFPPWGTFLIDLGNFAMIAAGTVGPTGADTLLVTVPNDPSFSGLTFYLQSLVVETFKPKVGALTDLASVTLQ